MKKKTEGCRITEAQIEAYRQALRLKEKSEATVEKYGKEVERLAAWLQGGAVTQQHLIAFKSQLQEEKKAARTINTTVAALNGFLRFIGWSRALQLSALRVQQRMFLEEERLLTKGEYLRLIEAAERKKNARLYFILQTICSSGMRISELRHVTVEAVQRKKVMIHCKGKIREIMLPDSLCEDLQVYLQRQEIADGPVFVTRGGKPLNRSNIWREMKQLCAAAEVNPNKVFPHNLRHLFARTFYEQERDIVKLADILGHSNIQTTRMYTLGTLQQEHVRINRMGLTVRARPQEKVEGDLDGIKRVQRVNAGKGAVATVVSATKIVKAEKEKEKETGCAVFGNAAAADD